MERLTPKYVTTDFENVEKSTLEYCNGQIPMFAGRSVLDYIHRLAELEDKIENGTLVEMPCIRQTHNHKGQIVYRVYFLDRYWNAIRYYEAKDESEAEKRLEELRK